jgi:hypothetical protein
MPIVAADTKRGPGVRRHTGVVAIAALAAICLGFLLAPWTIRVERYTIGCVGYHLADWRLACDRNSVNTSELIEANAVGPFRVLFLRPKGRWHRPWPF